MRDLTRRVLAVVLCSAASLHADDCEPVTFTTAEDHRQMQEQLGITELRPGRNGDASKPNGANYDEAKADVGHAMPALLRMADGETVLSAEEWRSRRAEIVQLFEREIVGRIPEDVPDVTWEVRETREGTEGDVPVVERRVVGVVDNTACPAIDVEIEMSLTLPKDVKGPVPVLVLFGRTAFEPPMRFGGREWTPPRPTRGEMLVERGWGFAMLNTGTIQADNGAGLTRGIIGLTNKGQPRKPDDWGSLRAWAWGASRALDFLETQPEVNADAIGIEGVSRWGKAALVAMAFDERFDVALIGSSGEGGASPYRRDFGETLENLAGSGEYHWMAGNFLKYAAEAPEHRDAGDLPVDAHMLIALCAPRPVFISYGVPEHGDALWLDQVGSYQATRLASAVYELLGVKGLQTEDGRTPDEMPAVLEGVTGGRLAWRQHDGGHTDGPNVPAFVEWAEGVLGVR